MPEIDMSLTAIDTLLRGTDSVYSTPELRERLATGKRLRVKLGMDPTAPDLHLGHTVVLRKMRQFQNAGHIAVLIIGDYTAMIGDPTGRSKTRPILSRTEVETNAQTYLQQAGKVLDLSPENFEVRHNSEWLAKMSCADVIKLLGEMTVARMLERDNFAKRQAEGREIYLHELLYPLMQGRDSVEIRADVELGGTDQTFNNLCGRDLQRNAGQAPQIVVIMPILVGTDGHEKMSKSLGNYIGITDTPQDMFGKIMRVPDELMRNYFELTTDTPVEEIAELCDASKNNPRNSKERLAKIIITQYHSAEAANAAAEEFRRVHGGKKTTGNLSGAATITVTTRGEITASGGQLDEARALFLASLPDEIPDVQVPPEIIRDGKVNPIDLLVHCLGEKSRGEAKKLIAEKGAKLNGIALEDPNAPLTVNPGDILQRGKRKFVRLRT